MRFGIIDPLRIYLSGKILTRKYTCRVSPRKKDEDRLDRIVRQWRQERPDVDVTALATFGRLFRAAELADQRLFENLAGHGLQPGWFDVLAALRRSGTPFELTPTQLMDATMLSSGGVTKRLDRLEEAGLIARARDPEDRRGTRVALTPEGLAAIDAAIVTHAAGEAKLLGALAPGDCRALDGALRKLLASLEPGQRSSM
jgi:DNA-binding MarR family transcriptional regulator